MTQGILDTSLFYVIKCFILPFLKFLLNKNMLLQCFCDEFELFSFCHVLYTTQVFVNSK